MRKSTFIKRFVALFLVVLMSINTFAAVVGDNDGAAFITKGEFDSMKNDFQSQLDRYNSSIDNKIDGAIASYLAGISIAKTSVLLDYLSPAYRADVNNVSFANWRTPQATADPVDAEAAFHRSWLWGVTERTQLNTKVFGYASLSNYAAWSGAPELVRYTNYTGATNNYTSRLYWAAFPFAILDESNLESSGNTQDWTLVDTIRHRCFFKLTATRISFSGKQFTLASTTNWPSYFNHPTFNSITADFRSPSTNTSTQPGTIEYVSQTWSPLGNVNVTETITHSWSTYASSDTSSNKFLSYNLCGAIANSTTQCVDYNFRDYYSNQNSVDVPIQRERPTTEELTGETPGSDLHLNLASTNQAWNVASGNSTYKHNIEFRFKWNTQKKYNLYWNRLTSSYWNGIFSEPYYKYYGVPVCRTTKNPGQLKLKLKFTSKKLSDNTNNQSSYRYQIMDKKFPNAAMPSSDMEAGIDHVLKTAQVNAGNPSYEVTLNLEKSTIWDSADGDYIYIKVEPSDADQYVIVETTDSIEYTEAG